MIRKQHKHVAAKVEVEVGGRTLTVSNLNKVLYPEAGFTKAEVISYYVQVAPVLLAHLGDRGITMRRFPDGVDAGSFFEKRCPEHRPDWVDVADDIESPSMVVFDLDPGPGTAMTECAAVAGWIREVLDGVGLQAWPKTSGSKGLQLYVPVNGPCSHQRASMFSHALAQVVEKAHGDSVVTTQAKAARVAKVLIDWSQNSRHKTTIAAYSLRARPRPTVSTPVTWEEVEAAAEGEPLSFEASDVLARLDELGDLFAPTTDLVQELPGAEP